MIGVWEAPSFQPAFQSVCCSVGTFQVRRFVPSRALTWVPEVSRQIITGGSLGLYRSWNATTGGRARATKHDAKETERPGL
jgi:hypothetical protein